MKHRIVAVSPQGKEYFGEFKEGIDPEVGCEEFFSEFAKSDFVNYKLILASGDTLFIPNLKDWHIVIEAKKEEVDMPGVKKCCNTCRHAHADILKDPCYECLRDGTNYRNWQPK